LLVATHTGHPAQISHADITSAEQIAFFTVKVAELSIFDLSADSADR